MPYIDEAMLEELRMRAAGSCRSAAADASPSPAVSAFDRIVRLVSVRDRCESELRRRLLREGYREDELEDAIERAVGCGLVDDLRFADALIRTRISQGRGRRGIQDELSRLDIEPSMLEGWPDDYFPDGVHDELERALDVLRRHPPRAKNVLQSSYRKLISKGFDSSVATQAARIHVRSMGEEAFL